MDLKFDIIRPETTVKGALVIVHGMAEHSKRYIPFARYLADQGYAVYTYDLPGHGENVEEAKGYFGENGWQKLIHSAEDAIKTMRKEYPGRPIILMGHSMGTIVSRCYLQDHEAEIDGLILTGAPNWQRAGRAGVALGKALRRRKGQKGLSKLMDTMVTGNFNKSVENPKTPVDWLSYNEDNIRAYLEDPECGFGFTVQGYIDELQGLNQMHDLSLYHCIKPRLPIALFAGKDDPCIGGEKGFADTVSTLKKAGYARISTKLYPHMRHEILNETDKEQVYEDIKNWLDAHFAA